MKRLRDGEVDENGIVQRYSNCIAGTRYLLSRVAPSSRKFIAAKELGGSYHFAAIEIDNETRKARIRGVNAFGLEKNDNGQISEKALQRVETNPFSLVVYEGTDDIYCLSDETERFTTPVLVGATHYPEDYFKLFFRGYNPHDRWGSVLGAWEDWANGLHLQNREELLI